MRIKFVLTIITCMFMSFVIQAADISAVEKVPVHAKFEVKADYDVTGINPYNYDKINCQAVVTSPDNRTFVLDGFYSKDFDFSYLYFFLKSIIIYKNKKISFYI